MKSTKYEAPQNILHRPVICSPWGPSSLFRTQTSSICVLYVDWETKFQSLFIGQKYIPK